MLSGMSYFLYQLSFDGPVHFGDTSLGGSLEQADWLYTSDTLFSSICTELASQGELKLLNYFVSLAQEGELLISDLLPYQLGAGDEPELFLPVPYIYFESTKKYVDFTLDEAKKLSAQRKLSKKRLYYRASELQAYCDCLQHGEAYKAKLNLIIGNELVVKKDNKFSKNDDTVIKLNFNNEFITEKVNCRDEMPRPYFVKGNVFASGAGLYLLAKMPEYLVETFQNVLCSLGLSGIGGKRSSGFGRFHLYDDALELDDMFADTKALYSMLNDTYKRYMCISSLLPNDNEIETVQSGMYKLKKSSGFSEGIKRDSVYMLSAGSCFASRLKGQIVDLGGVARHPVWRYGKGVYVGLNI